MRRVETPIHGLVSGECVPIQEHVWKGPCFSQFGQQLVYVKLLTPAKLMVECIAAMIGRAHDLPIPRPFLLMADGQYLPGCDIPNTQYWAYGAEASEFPSLARLTRVREEICRRLRGWKRASEAAAFDSWIGNEDRTEKNLLWADDASQVQLIDHDDALPDWLSPEQETANKLMDLLCDERSEHERHQQRRQALRAVTPYPKTDWQGALDAAAWADRFSRAQEVERLLNFLAVRIEHLPQIIAAAAGTRQQELSYANRNTPYPQQ